MAELEVFAVQGRYLVELEKLRADLDGTHTLTLGRSPEVDITIDDDDTVSKRHAQFSLVAGKWAVEDVGSTNGTSVNGDRFTGRRTLRNGDQIRFGSTTTRFRDFTDADSSTAKPRPVPPITKRERDVLVELCRPFFSRGRLKAAGTRAAVSAALFMGEPAVQAHLLHLYDKFGIEGKKGERRDLLALEAMDAGVITQRDYAESGEPPSR